MAAIPVFLFACGSELEGVAPDVDRDTDTSEVGDTSPDTTDTVPDDTEPGDVDTTDTGPDDTTDTDVFVPPPEWAVESLGDLGRIDDITLGSATLGFAASGPRVLRWDGRSWLAFGEPGDGQEVRGVATDGVLVAAVGQGGLVATRLVDGGAWQRLEGGPSVDLYAAALRDGRLFVAGDQGTVASIELGAETPTFTTHFTSPVVNIRALWADPAKTALDGVHAVGAGGYHIYSTGESWGTLQVTQNSVTLLDVIGLADGTLVTVGDQHTVAVKPANASSWRAQVTNDERRRNLAGLALSRDGTLRAFGASGAVLRQTVDNWTVESAAGVAAGLKNFRVATAVPGSSAVMALAAEGGGVRFDGTTWQAVATSPESTVNDFAGTADSLWAVGNRGVLAHRKDGVWNGIPTHGAADLNAIAVAQNGIVWAVGDAGLVIKIDGGVPTHLTAPVPLDLFGVAVTATKVWACGRGGTLLEIDPDTNTMTVRVSGTTADLKAMAVGGDGAVWLSGSFGTLLRMNDLAPLPILSGVGGSLNDLAPTGNGVLVVGDNGVILRATATSVDIEHEEPGRFLYAIATSPDARDTVAIAVGAGRILRQSGADWVAEVPAENAATFEAAWVGAAGEALIGGIYRVHHLESRILPLEGAP